MPDQELDIKQKIEFDSDGLPIPKTIRQSVKFDNDGLPIPQKKSGGEGGTTTLPQSTSKLESQDVIDPKSFEINRNQLAAGQQSSSDNTAASQVGQTVKYQDAILHGEEREKAKKEKTDKAIANTALNSLKLKGIKPTATNLNQEKAKYQKQIENGDAHVALDKDGVPGLKRVTGGLENLVNGWNEARNSTKESDKFVTGTTKDRVDFVNKNPDKVKQSEYIGERPNGLGDLTHFVGGAAPFLGKAALGSAIGAGLVAAAPETAGASLSLLPTVLPILMTSRESATHGAMEETIRRYQIIKKDNPDLSDTEAMEKAEGGMIAGGIGGVLTNAAMLGTGLRTPVSAASKSLLGNTVKHIVKSSLEMGAISGVGTGLVQEEGNLEGVKTSQSDILKNVVTSFKDNAEAGLLLTGLIHGVPNVLKSGIKYALVKDTKPELIKQDLQVNEANGIIPEGTTDKVMNDIAGYKEALDKTAGGLTPEVEASVAGLIQKRTDIEAEAKEKDVSAQPVYKEKIDAINKQIEDIQRTGRPLEHEIDEATGRPYIQPKFDDDAKAKVEDLADKISKGKRVEDAEDLQTEANFKEELDKQLQRIAKEEKSTQKDKENPNTDLSDNIEKYHKKYSAEKEATKERITVIKPEDNKPPNVVEIGKEEPVKSDADIEKRMAEIEGDIEKQDEFNLLEKEMEKRERATVFNVPLENVFGAVDALMKKDKEQPNGFGSFIERRDASETKAVAEKYLNLKEISDQELKTDFKNAVMGNPDTWYADGLKLRESMKEAANRGINAKDLIAEVEKEFIKDGYSSQDAKEVVAAKLKPIFEKSTPAKKEIGKEEPVAEPSIPTEEEFKNAEQVSSHADAEARLSAGERVFAAHDMGEEPIEITSVDQLKNWAPDQLMAIKKEEPVAETSIEDKREVTHGVIERTPEEIKQISREKIDYEKTQDNVTIPDIDAYESGAKDLPLKKVKAMEGRTELRQRLKAIENIIKCL